jgi:hypothetical protein
MFIRRWAAVKASFQEGGTHFAWISSIGPVWVDAVEKVSRESRGHNSIGQTATLSFATAVTEVASIAIRRVGRRIRAEAAESRHQPNAHFARGKNLA